MKVFSKRLSERLSLTCISLLAGFLATKAQNTSILAADSLFNQGLVDEAFVAYERVYYTENDEKVKHMALYKKAEKLKSLSKFERAELCLSRIDLSRLEDSFSFQVRYQMSLNAYLSKHFTEAESYLTQMIYFLPDSNLTAKALPLLALTLNELQKWEEADRIMTRYKVMGLADSMASCRLSEMYSPKNRPKLKSPKKASILSSVLPGMGQVYAGYFVEGLGSAVAQVACLGFTGVALWQRYYITSLLVGYSTFYRFYQGGIGRAEFLANKKNYELSQKYNAKLKALIVGEM